MTGGDQRPVPDTRDASVHERLDEFDDVLDDFGERLNDLEMRMDAFSRGADAIRDDLAELEDAHAALDTTVGRLQSRVTPDPTGKAYDELSREDKITRVRHALARTAVRNGGKARKTYSEVRALFDDRPSVGHCYDLMNWAGDATGFEYQEFDDGRDNRLVIRLDDVADEAVLHAAAEAAEDQP